MPDQKLQGKVALVSGATRGAGRGIACMLGEAGATVYCSGRSTREHPCRTGFYAGRLETIDETAEMVTRHGSAGIPVRTDHLVPDQVEELAKRVRREQGRFVGRAIAALASDPGVLEKSGGLYGSWTLARDYGVTDIDGSQPDLGRHFDFEKHFRSSRKTVFRWTVSSPAMAQREKKR